MIQLAAIVLVHIVSLVSSDNNYMAIVFTVLIVLLNIATHGYHVVGNFQRLFLISQLHEHFPKISFLSSYIVTWPEFSKVFFIKYSLENLLIIYCCMLSVLSLICSCFKDHVNTHSTT